MSAPPSDGPLTVVVAAPPRAPCPRATLHALAEQEEYHDLIAAIVLAGSESLRAELAPPPLRPRVAVVTPGERAAEPALWEAGLRLADSPYVAFLDSLALPDPTWARRIVEALDAGAHVAGGAVEPELDPIRSRPSAAFLCDYGAFLPPLPPGDGNAPGGAVLPGNNVAFRIEPLRIALRRAPGLGLRKSFLIPAMVRDGAAVRRVPEARIRLREAPASFGRLLLEHAARGRAYAGLRSASWSGRRRLARAAAAPAVPPVLLARLERELRSRPAARRALLRSLPASLALLSAWAAGEAVGLLRGAGDTSRVR